MPNNAEVSEFVWVWNIGMFVNYTDRDLSSRVIEFFLFIFTYVLI